MNLKLSDSAFLLSVEFAIEVLRLFGSFGFTQSHLENQTCCFSRSCSGLTKDFEPLQNSSAENFVSASLYLAV